MKLNIIQFVELLTQCNIWYDQFDDETDASKFKILYEWFNEYESLNFEDDQSIIDHFLNCDLLEGDEYEF